MRIWHKKHHPVCGEGYRGYGMKEKTIRVWAFDIMLDQRTLAHGIAIFLLFPLKIRRR